MLALGENRFEQEFLAKRLERFDACAKPCYARIMD
jgi:hypothetical protein